MTITPRIIICPACGVMRRAQVERATGSFDTHCHTCECGSIIGASEWTVVRVYLSGPMTGLPEMNRPAFAAAALALRAAGYEVVSPAEIDCGTVDWHVCMRKVVAAMLTCHGVAMMEDWETSKGSRIEHRLAAEVGLSLGPLCVWAELANA